MDKEGSKFTLGCCLLLKAGGGRLTLWMLRDEREESGLASTYAWIVKRRIAIMNLEDMADGSVG